MVSFDWLGGELQPLAGWRSVTTRPGEPSATMGGKITIVVLHAVNLVFSTMVISYYQSSIHIIF